MKNLKYILLDIVMLELIIILSIITININKLKKENKELKEEMKRIEVTNKLYYEDLLQLLEK